MYSRWILTLIAIVGLCCFTTMSRAEDKEKNEKDEESTEVKFDDLPAAVKATLTREAAGAKIEKVEKESEDGKVIYEADVTVNGQEWEIKVGEDGKLISKEEEKDEQDEKKEDDKK